MSNKRSDSALTTKLFVVYSRGMRLHTISAIPLFIVAAAHAQPTPSRPAFEVASVKPVISGRGGPGPLHGGPGTDSPGELTGAASLKALLMRAFNLKAYQIAGPAWMESERYQITAKISPDATRERIALMLQSLLADRFQLRAHLESRNLPAYTMVVAGNGSKLKEATSANQQAPAHAFPNLRMGLDGFPELPPGAQLLRSYEIVVGGSDGQVYKLWARHETTAQLADRLSSHLSRPVLDRTELTAQYDFALTWSSESAGGVVPRTDPPPDEIDVHQNPILSDVPSIFTAIQAQLGLRLQETKAALSVLVVDSVDKIPTSN
jgi:uncharacterized protein (TIGR03435 family)